MGMPNRLKNVGFGLMKLTTEKRQIFLDELAAGNSVTSGARLISVSTVALYKLRHNDAEFASKWAEALESGTDILEDEAVRRAKDGSDTLLIFLLKGRRPAKYREHVRVTVTEVDKMIDMACEEHNLPLPETFGGEPLNEPEM